MLWPDENPITTAMILITVEQKLIPVDNTGLSVAIKELDSSSRNSPMGGARENIRKASTILGLLKWAETETA